MNNFVNGPKHNEIEITILGPGFGECVIIHYGENHWFVVDSCIERGGVSAAAIGYLESIGVSPADAVDLILVTHYHSDHIGGLLNLVTACPRATFAFSPGAEPKKFVTFIGAFQKSPAINNGASEPYDSFALVKERNQQIVLCGANKPLLQHVSAGTGIETKVTSLSPSDSDCFEFLEFISRNMPGRGARIGRLLAPNDNLLSCAAWVEIGDRKILLGADLEERDRPNTGWSAVLRSSLRPQGIADVIKVPHHGSRNGHHDGVWEQMLSPVDLIAVVTPWNRSQGLPTREDCGRISARAPKSYLTSTRTGLSLRHGQAVERTLRESGIELSRSDSPLGWVRVRAPIDNPATSWTLERSSNPSPLSALA
jgi:beta-lactamase superfamily II metal-dependent hydrolase